MAINKTKKSVKKVETLGFVNWSIETKKGILNSNRGFPIFQNPEYPDDKEELLIAAAKKNGGMVELTMKVRIYACGSEAKKTAITVKDLI